MSRLALRLEHILPRQSLRLYLIQVSKLSYDRRLRGRSYLSRDYAEPGSARIPDDFNEWTRKQNLEKYLGSLPYLSTNIEITGDQGIDGLTNWGKFYFRECQDVARGCAPR